MKGISPVLGSQKMVNHNKFLYRPFVITPITGTNLLLLIIDTVCPSNDFVLTTEPMDQEYGNYSLACFKNEMNIFSRKRPTKCIDRHENVSPLNYFRLF